MSADILRILVILLGIAVVAVVLIQQPKEGGMGMFSGGGGASGTVFGAKGSGSFLFRLTAGLALALAIAIIALVKVTNSDLGGSVLFAESSEQSSEVIPGETVNINNAADNVVPGSVNSEELDTIPGTADTNIQESTEKQN